MIAVSWQFRRRDNRFSTTAISSMIKHSQIGNDQYHCLYARVKARWKRQCSQVLGYGELTDVSSEQGPRNWYVLLFCHPFITPNILSPMSRSVDLFRNARILSRLKAIPLSVDTDPAAERTEPAFSLEASRILPAAELDRSSISESTPT